jgi:hypothetical protein
VSAGIRHEAKDAARAFVDTWATDGRTMPRASWLKAVKPLTTGALFQGLRDTDPARLPVGRPARVALTEVGAFSGAATVTLTDSLRVDVRMVVEGGTWVVSDIQPAGP